LHPTAALLAAQEGELPRARKHYAGLAKALQVWVVMMISLAGGNRQLPLFCATNTPASSGSPT